MKLKTYLIISRAIEEGVQYGVNRSFKHTDKPEVSHIIDTVHNSVMNSLCEIIEFDDEEVELEEG